MSEHILDELSWRGLIAQSTDIDALRRELDQGPLTLYCGFDPTAPSLHAGNLVPLLMLKRFQRAGHLYVYFVYGMHFCANIVGTEEGQPGAVLLRAGEVVQGLDLVRKRRPNARGTGELAKGPAILTSVLRIDRALNGADACEPGGPFRILSGTPPRPAEIRSGPRTGVGGDGADHPWRYWIDGDPTVSPYRAHTPRKRRK